MTGTRGLVLQPRDRRLLQALETMKVIERGHAMSVAGFRSVTRANSRLLRLTQAGYLRRLFLGSRCGKALYVLTSKGAGAAGVYVWHLHRRKSDTVVIDPFIEHQLALNSLRILIYYSQPPPSATGIGEWKAFPKPISESLPLSPDGYFELTCQELIHPMFLEVDRGTEGQKIWKKKTENYLRLAASGEFENRFGKDRFRVLVVANSGRRIHSIRATVAKQTAKIFWFATIENINKHGFWSSIWLRPLGDQKLPLP